MLKINLPVPTMYVAMRLYNTIDTSNPTLCMGGCITSPPFCSASSSGLSHSAVGSVWLLCWWQLEDSTSSLLDSSCWHGVRIVWLSCHPLRSPFLSSSTVVLSYTRHLHLPPSPVYFSLLPHLVNLSCSLVTLLSLLLTCHLILLTCRPLEPSTHLSPYPAHLSPS